MYIHGYVNIKGRLLDEDKMIFSWEEVVMRMFGVRMSNGTGTIHVNQTDRYRL